MTGLLGNTGSDDSISPPSTSERGVTIRIPRPLASPNTWNGRHWRVKHRISQEWERELVVALRLQGMSLTAAWARLAEGKGYEAGDYGDPERCRVEVTREVPSGRNFIRDDDNLRFCVKPLLDALKRCGLIKNDSRKWIELPTPEQKISADGNYWTEVVIERVEADAKG